MDSDEDDTPLTFRRSSQNASQSEKPKAAPKPSPPAPKNSHSSHSAQSRQGPGLPGQVKKPQVSPSAAGADDIPLSKRVVNGGVKRPPEASPEANGQLKRPKVEGGSESPAPGRPHGAGSAPGSAPGQRQGQGQVQGQGPKQGQGQRPAQGQGQGQGQKQGQGQGQGQSPGQRQSPAQVSKQGQGKGQGVRPGSVQSPGQGHAARKGSPATGAVKAEPHSSPQEIKPTPPARTSVPANRVANGPASIKKVAKEEVKEEEDGGEGEEEDDEEEEEDGDEEDEEEEEEEEDGDEEDSEEDEVPLARRGGAATKAKPAQKQTKNQTSTSTPKTKTQKSEGGGRGGGGKKKEDNSVKWKTLSHNGVIFPPLYTPHGIKILYNGKEVDLTPEQEEVATMFAVMRETEYYTKPKFLANFWEDWKKILGSRHVIQKLDLCDFTPIWEWHCREKEKKKQMTSEEKKLLKEEKTKAEEKFTWAVIDGVKEKVGNFRVEPPGLFRGRGEHPKMGKLKRRIMPEDITINIGKEATVPECPMPGHRWREVRNDNTVTWLAYWTDPINNKEFKYVFLAASSRLKGLSDKEKYEKARKLKDHIDKIRANYTKNFKTGDEMARQVAVATYLIDRLALRAGNEKDDDEADTVGCCSLKVEHVTRVAPSSLQFDFLGKDSIRYFNTVEVHPDVYVAIGDFQKKKKKDEDLFHRLDTSKLNAHLKEIMPGLTAKVFRTYNASVTLDSLLQDTIGADAKEKIADYQRANKEVAILCNHQRSVSKAHANQMEKLQTKVAELETTIEELEEDLVCVRKGKPPKDRPGKDPPAKTPGADQLEKKISQAKARLDKMKLDMTIKDEMKTVALGTSKINYMDPRITVAWCKRHDVPIEKIFNKSLLAKFAWAMDVEPDYRF